MSLSAVHIRHHMDMWLCLHQYWINSIIKTYFLNYMAGLRYLEVKSMYLVFQERIDFEYFWWKDVTRGDESGLMAVIRWSREQRQDKCENTQQRQIWAGTQRTNPQSPLRKIQTGHFWPNPQSPSNRSWYLPFHQIFYNTQLLPEILVSSGHTNITSALLMLPYL